jgi:hypothetical protein
MNTGGSAYSIPPNLENGTYSMNGNAGGELLRLKTGIFSSCEPNTIEIKEKYRNAMILPPPPPPWVKDDSW